LQELVVAKDESLIMIHGLIFARHLKSLSRIKEMQVVQEKGDDDRHAECWVFWNHDWEEDRTAGLTEPHWLRPQACIDASEDVEVDVMFANENAAVSDPTATGAECYVDGKPVPPGGMAAAIEEADRARLELLDTTTMGEREENKQTFITAPKHGV